MSPKARRVLQAILYEGIAISIVAPTITFLFGTAPGSAFALSAVMSGIALAWNYVFNALFERWEVRQATRGRTLGRRIAHGLGFEGGLAVMLVPVMALWLGISLRAAFVADLEILVFFFVYTVAFTWVFDRIFGLPASARPLDPAAASKRPA